jgi:hypothetical protein
MARVLRVSTLLCAAACSLVNRSRDRNEILEPAAACTRTCSYRSSRGGKNCVTVHPQVWKALDGLFIQTRDEDCIRTSKTAVRTVWIRATPHPSSSEEIALAIDSMDRQPRTRHQFLLRVRGICTMQRPAGPGHERATSAAPAGRMEVR